MNRKEIQLRLSRLDHATVVAEQQFTNSLMALMQLKPAQTNSSLPRISREQANPTMHEAA